MDYHINTYGNDRLRQYIAEIGGVSLSQC